jgi:hypothetical protein
MRSSNPPFKFKWNHKYHVKSGSLTLPFWVPGLRAGSFGAPVPEFPAFRPETGNSGTELVSAPVPGLEAFSPETRNSKSGFPGLSARRPGTLNWWFESYILESDLIIGFIITLL